MKVLRIIALALAGLSSAALLLSISVLIRYLTWDFNEEGNHFDEETATNYTDGGVIAWSLLTILFLAISFLLFFLAWRLKKRQLRQF